MGARPSQLERLQQKVLKKEGVFGGEALSSKSDYSPPIVRMPATSGCAQLITSIAVPGEASQRLPG